MLDNRYVIEGEAEFETEIRLMSGLFEVMREMLLFWIVRVDTSTILKRSSVRISLEAVNYKVRVDISESKKEESVKVVLTRLSSILILMPEN